MNAAVDRRFLAILGLSLALHASLFALTSWQRKHGTIALPPILASIRLLNVSESGPVAAAPSAQSPATVPQKVRQPSPRVEGMSSRRVPPAVGPATTPNTPLASAAPATPAVAGVAAPVVASSASVPAAEAVPQRSQAELMAGYRQRLSELLARHQEYPRIAALRGWEGEVRLRLRVARKGNLLAVQLDHSSGFEVLDQHAMAMLEALAGLPPLPEALDSNEIQVIVPINYKLKKTT